MCQEWYTISADCLISLHQPGDLAQGQIQNNRNLAGGFAVAAVIAGGGGVSDRLHVGDINGAAAQFLP